MDTPYEVQNGRVVNAAGEVALRWNVLTQKLVSVHKREYLFVIKANIALAWVKPEDVEAVLAIRTTCCGGTRNISCHLASELDAKRWLGIAQW